MAKTTRKAASKRAAKPAPVTFALLLAELAGAFVTDKRSDGTSFVKLADDAPLWTTRDATDGNRFCLMLRLHSAVDDRGPDDWVYQAIHDMVNALAGYGCETADNLRETVSEAADGEVDVYNASLTRWLASHLANAALVDEAVSEMGWDKDRGIFGAIALGQYRALEALGNAIIAEVEAELERRNACRGD